MASFAAMLSSYFKSFESSEHGNNLIDLPFQSWNVIEFSSLLLPVLLALRNLLHCDFLSTSC